METTQTRIVRWARVATQKGEHNNDPRERDRIITLPFSNERDGFLIFNI
jgi:hypothetical protein